MNHIINDMTELTLFDQPPVLNRYHNTTDLLGACLKQREIRTETQNKKVLDFFKLHPSGSFTPFEVRDALKTNSPITSIRRAITDLTDMGYLVKTDTKRPGQYGDLNNCWRAK